MSRRRTLVHAALWLEDYARLIRESVTYPPDFQEWDLDGPGVGKQKTEHDHMLKLASELRRMAKGPDLRGGK